MRVLVGLTLLSLALMLASLLPELPGRGDPTAPCHAARSAAGGQVAGSYYIDRAYRDAHTPNIVTVVLGDYRSFDTLGEALVVFAGGIACLLILRRERARARG